MERKFFWRELCQISKILLICCLSFASFATHTEKSNLIDEETWVLVQSNQDFEVYSSIEICDGQEFYFFKIKNLTDEIRMARITVTVAEAVTHGPINFSHEVGAKTVLKAECANRMLRLPKQVESNRSLKDDLSITFIKN